MSSNQQKPGKKEYIPNTTDIVLAWASLNEDTAEYTHIYGKTPIIGWEVNDELGIFPITFSEFNGGDVKDSFEYALGGSDQAVLIDKYGVSYQDSRFDNEESLLRYLNLSLVEAAAIKKGYKWERFSEKVKSALLQKSNQQPEGE